MAKQATCKGCGAAIVWATNPATGNKVPLDLKPLVYRVVDLPNGEAECLVEEDNGELGVNHFATCPKANDFHRKPGESA